MWVTCDPWHGRQLYIGLLVKENVSFLPLVYVEEILTFKITSVTPSRANHVVETYILTIKTLSNDYDL